MTPTNGMKVKFRQKLMQPELSVDPAAMPDPFRAAVLRVAFAMIDCNRRDGSARAVNEVAERMVDKGHEVHLYARKAEDLDLRKVRWHKIPGIGWPEVMNFWTYHVLANRKLAGSNHDIIHSIGCNTLCGNVITIQNVQPAKKKVLDALSRGEDVSTPRRLTRALYLKLTSAAERRLYTHRAGRKPLMFLPVSRGVEKELRACYDIGPAQVRLVPNAADVEKFKPLAEKERQTWRQAHGIIRDEILLLFAGGEWARKGLDFAIRALALMKGNRRATLFVAGDDPDRARFVEMARQTGCAQSVIFGGFRRDMAKAMAAADVFLFPSWYEAFSLATIEAAACGLPVVVTRINGTDDFIKPGENGEFIEHDAAQIASVLDRLCATPEQLREMGAQGRKLVQLRYTWDRVTAMTEEAYREYLDGVRAG
jgi:glycosyltransferase involved in cell wall biosynthesis